jgi:7,8-dihydropterin-6-yl-methyl-4-(beta-D-ribofuranosyl)aminobenzene 5'-phosphate synthase
MGQGLKEQALVINTPAGLILIVGCSHPGILNILKKTKRLFQRPVYLVIGGFHTMPDSPEGMRQVIHDFKMLGVSRVAPAHCTNEAAKVWFQKGYGQNYIECGVGRELHFRFRHR